MVTVNTTELRDEVDLTDFMEASDLDWSIVTNLYDEFDQTKIINDSLRLPQLTGYTSIGFSNVVVLL